MVKIKFCFRFVGEGKDSESSEPHAFSAMGTHPIITVTQHTPSPSEHTYPVSLNIYITQSAYISGESNVYITQWAHLLGESNIYITQWAYLSYESNIYIIYWEYIPGESNDYITQWAYISGEANIYITQREYIPGESVFISPGQ